MVGTLQAPRTEFFTPHPNLDDLINRNICQSEIEGGVFLNSEVPAGALFEVETRNRFYEVQNCGDGRILIAGHPKYCPEPVTANLHGSTWGGSMLKMRFIGRGMFLEFRHPTHGVIRTSRIREVREVAPADNRFSRFRTPSSMHQERRDTLCPPS